MKDLIITLPQTITWEDYQREIDDVKLECMEMNFKVPFHPKDIELGKTKVFVTHKGIIKGYMILSALRIFNEDWICDTSGTIMGAGKYLVRTGEFFYVDDDPVKFKGFQGFRYIDFQKEYDSQYMEKECFKCHEWTGPLHASGCSHDQNPQCAWYVGK